MNLILCNGFNYYNRIIKKYDTYTDYYQFMPEGANVLTNINFNPADGVNTSQVVNWDSTTPDYVVCVDDNNEINSRWYVIDAVRTRAGQLRLDLHRDLIVDYYDNVIDSPMFIEKATVPSINDIAIYNKEEIQFNQIKQSETLLKDSTKIPWIVGYFTGPSSTINVSVPKGGVSVVGEYEDNAAFFSAIGYSGGKWRTPSNLNIEFNTSLEPQLIANGRGKINITKGTNELLSLGIIGYQARFSSVPTGTGRQPWLNKLTTYLSNNLEAIETVFYSTSATLHKDACLLDGKYVKIGSDIKLITLSTSTGSTTTDFDKDSTMFSEIKDLIDETEEYTFSILTGGYDSITATYNYTDYVITLSTIDNSALTTKISSTAKSLSDAPYKMFMMPADKIAFQKLYTIPWTVTITKEEELTIAAKIAENLSDNCYDIQLLPYFPFNNLYVKKSGNFPYINFPSTFTEGVDYELVKDSDDNILSFILYGDFSTFSFDITSRSYVPDTVVNAKIVNQCEMLRMCSPNYSSIFEFNELRNGDTRKINVDCTYKPYSPYIHLNPVWNNKSLYGGDYNDVRGLICQGDFSLPIVNDQWKTYQINNKNYLNSFNRDIDSIELQNKYAKIGDVLNATTGAIGAGVSAGVQTGSVGLGIASGVASAAAGVLDVSINEKLRNDALDLRKDQFNYSLQNIQALPKTLARISSYDANNKIFPLIEYYSCTDQEKEIFENKMLYNGMTIGRIDKMSSFITTTKQYIKGQLIRLEGLEECTHECNAIADELYKGVYI